MKFLRLVYTSLICDLCMSVCMLGSATAPCYFRTGCKIVLYSRRSDRSVSLLSSCVPDLSFDGLAFYLDAACGKLYPDGTLALQVELIPGEAGQQVTLPYA